MLVIGYCLPKFNWSLIIVGVMGMGFGGFLAAFYLLAVPEDTRLKRAQTIANFGKHHIQHVDIVDGVPSWSSSTQKKEEIVAEINGAEHQRVSISPDIDPMVEEMITYTVRDFVNIPIGLVAEGQHNIPLRTSLATMAMNVANRLSNMRLPETALLAVFGLQNSFIVHLRAYRELRASQLPIAEYVKTHANPDSVLGRCYHKEERLKQFRSTAKAVCQALLSKNDQQSAALFAVMQEIMATHVLEATLEHICDPDYINLSIIDYFTTPTQDKPGSKSADDSKGPSNKSGNPEVKPQDAPISSLADSILMNAANLMGKSALGKQSFDSGSQLPTRRQSTLKHDSMPVAPSTLNEVNGTEASPSSSSLSSSPQLTTLKQVLTNKNDHMDTYQDFMAYLQVWDAMDLVQFWLMSDIFHRQIEQGTFANFSDLQREASSIYNTYCGPDPDHAIVGITDAKSGALLKTLKANLQRDPANCLREPQEWALDVLETQYWAPFRIKQNTDKNVQQAQMTPQGRSQPSPQTVASPNLSLHSQDIGQRKPHLAINHSSPSLSPREPTPKEPTTSSVLSPVAKFIASPRTQPCAVKVTDMTNRRPKTLMSTTDLLYMIEVQSEGGQGWVVTRTFQQLEQLQGALVHQFPIVQRNTFPRWRLQPSDKVCNGIQTFLRSMLAIPEVSQSASLAWLLSKEYDQYPDAIMPGAITGQNSSSGLISALAPISDGSAALGAAAAQGAKTAFRQASEASLSAGRFFKSLGTAVSNINSSQASEDHSVRGSFESERSTRSISSISTLNEYRQSNGSSLASPTTRLHEQEFDTHSRMSLSSDSTRVATRKASLSNGLFKAVDNTTAVAQSSPNPYLQPQSTDRNSTLVHAPIPRRTQMPYQGSDSLDEFSYQLLEEQTQPDVDIAQVTPETSAERVPAIPVHSTSTINPASVSTSPAAQTGLPSSDEPKKSQMSLLSNDELDLLIETTFTVLEDMMDFSKSQSIRRMTFGVLRELVRKSYRVAINQSFSAWVEQCSSHESAVETVRWMKEDLLWPNGEWPAAPTTAPTIQANPNDVASDERRDFLQIGGDQYEVGSDGIAVKVPKVITTSETRTATATQPTGATVASKSERTLEEKVATREKARELVKIMVPGSLATVLGREAVQRGLIDVFEMFQIKELNLGLALSVLEMVVRLVLTR
ncbi:PXA domain-domain-containing protein [Lobosporangium transversale]|uniref:PXA domain-domain-containing protein n=1 Tax=Lobosporangium transversale TaxID=64571 RepID=A0A1Y2GHV7_9FUNG|nr:PXA domain-domain-containing protein [Lobosporangium transversale]ORZ10257.1 PXA domain-domain-containing protein [Lobosporangium transversale]|eukprot:XP_021879164.1 PXA domain-domain-containing protein [Lobosporangium transversale]